jgi:hypothetical protein
MTTDENEFDDVDVMAGDPVTVDLYSDEDFSLSVQTWPSGYFEYVTNELQLLDRKQGWKFEFVEAFSNPSDFRQPIPPAARAAMDAHWARHGSFFTV